jgi:hypothetical protein
VSLGLFTSNPKDEKESVMPEEPTKESLTFRQRWNSWKWKNDLVIDEQRQHPGHDLKILGASLIGVVVSFAVGLVAWWTGKSATFFFNTLLLGLIISQGLIGACQHLKHQKTWAAITTLASIAAWGLSLYFAS